MTTPEHTYRPCAGCDSVGESCRAVGCPATPERDGAAVEAVVREWPCDDYLPPLTCWTTPKPKMLICAGCRESFPSGPDVQTAIAAREAAAKAEALREAADDMPFGYSHAAALLRELADREAT